MSINNYFKEKLNNDVYSYIIDTIYKQKKDEFIKNCKSELLEKIEGLCSRKIDYYRNDETGDLSKNQTLFYHWNFYLYRDIKGEEGKCDCV